MVAIAVECNADELFVRKMGFPNINHAGNKGNVVKAVEDSETKIIGIIDEDPGSTPPKSLSHYRKTNQSRSVDIMNRGDKKAIILLKPRFENWILNISDRNNINPANFNLPSRWKDLHNISKPQNDQNYKDFLEELVDNSMEVQSIKNFIASF